jgi:hypothetical protein
MPFTPSRALRTAPASSWQGPGSGIWLNSSLPSISKLFPLSSKRRVKVRCPGSFGFSVHVNAGDRGRGAAEGGSSGVVGTRWVATGAGGGETIQLG